VWEEGGEKGGTVSLPGQKRCKRENCIDITPILKNQLKTIRAYRGKKGYQRGGQGKKGGACASKIFFTSKGSINHADSKRMREATKTPLIMANMDHSSVTSPPSANPNEAELLSEGGEGRKTNRKNASSNPLPLFSDWRKAPRGKKVGQPGKLGRETPTQER